MNCEDAQNPTNRNIEILCQLTGLMLREKIKYQSDILHYSNQIYLPNSLYRIKNIENKNEQIIQNVLPDDFNLTPLKQIRP